MDDDPLAVALKFGFLAVLYLFLLWVARSAMRDLAPAEDALGDQAPAAGGRRTPADGSRGRNGTRPRLEVVAAMGREPGTAFDVSHGALLGRSDGADIVVEDRFASSAHARLFPRGGFMYIEDMDSTNGTFLNGRQIRAPERLTPADLIRIGDTEYRYRE